MTLPLDRNGSSAVEITANRCGTLYADNSSRSRARAAGSIEGRRIVERKDGGDDLTALGVGQPDDERAAAPGTTAPSTAPPRRA